MKTRSRFMTLSVVATLWLVILCAFQNCGFSGATAQQQTNVQQPTNAPLTSELAADSNDPVISLTLNDGKDEIAIRRGESYTLWYTSTNSSRCKLTYVNEHGQTGGHEIPHNTSGSGQSGMIGSYTMTCVGNTSVSKTVTIREVSGARSSSVKCDLKKDMLVTTQNPVAYVNTDSPADCQRYCESKAVSGNGCTYLPYMTQGGQCFLLITVAAFVTYERSWGAVCE